MNAKSRRQYIRSSKRAAMVRGAGGALRPAAIGLASVLATGGMAQQPEATAASTEQVAAPVESTAAPPASAARAVATEGVATSEAVSPLSPAPTPLAPTATVVPREPEQQFSVPPVEVQAEADRYRTPNAQLPRLPKSLLDTPQAVTVVPEAVIQEQSATTVREALRNVSGITIAAGEGGRQGDTFILRGFSAQTDVYRDGVRDLGWFTRETFNLGGVETYFGPSAVLFGRGATGGAVNLVTKKPVDQAFQELRISGGTAPSGRIEIDINQPVHEKAQFRLAGAGQLAQVAGRDEVEENRFAVAPSARLELGEKTRLELDYLLQRESSVPDYGHPFFGGEPVSVGAGVRRDVFYGIRGSDTELVTANIATARVLHAFSPQVLLTNTLRFGRVDRFARPTAPRGVAPSDSPTTLGRQRFETETDNTYLINQTDGRMTFKTFALEHALNVGAELAREARAQFRDNLQAVGLPTGPNLVADLYLPDPNPDLSAIAHVFNNSSQTEQLTLALYAGDQLTITRWLEVLASARFDFFETEYLSKVASGAVSEQRRVDRLLNWRAGLVFKPFSWTSAYMTYGTSTNPSAEAGLISTGTESLEPERNQVFELGTKGDLFSKRVSVGASVFRIEKLNGRVPNPEPGGAPIILGGIQRVDGLNLGAAGTLLPRWRAFVSYTFLHGRIVEHPNAFLVDQAIPSAPEHSASLWTTYELIDRLTLGGGVVYQSSATVNNPANEMTMLNRVPEFWRFDAVATYAFANADLQLNLSNLTDRLYYEQYSGGHAVPVEGRSAILTIRTRL
jgi:catecholate siderophore receptor